MGSQLNIIEDMEIDGFLFEIKTSVETTTGAGAMQTTMVETVVRLKKLALGTATLKEMMVIHRKDVLYKVTASFSNEPSREELQTVHQKNIGAIRLNITSIEAALK